MEKAKKAGKRHLPNYPLSSDKNLFYPVLILLEL
jgi:hypothetical protein